MADNTGRPVPGRSEFTADEMANMKLAQDTRQIAPAPDRYKRMRQVAQQLPYRIGPDDATDDQ